MKALSHKVSMTMKHVRVRNGSGKIKGVEIRRCRDKYTYNIHNPVVVVNISLPFFTSVKTFFTLEGCIGIESAKM